MNIGIGDWPTWVAAIAAVVSLIGTAVSWWRSNLSKAAKQEAEAARDEAQRQLKAMEEMAEATATIAKGIQAISGKTAGDLITAEWKSRNSLVLTNEIREPLHILAIFNLDEFPAPLFETTKIIEARQSITVELPKECEEDIPAVLHLHIRNRGIRSVDISGRPPKTEKEWRFGWD